jgi:hypothetical protein
MGRMVHRRLPGNQSGSSTRSWAYKTFHDAWLSGDTSQDPGLLLNQIIVKRDGIGRLLQEDFGLALEIH